MLGRAAVQRTISTPPLLGLHAKPPTTSPSPPACHSAVISLNPKALEVQSLLKITGLLETPNGQQQS